MKLLPVHEQEAGGKTRKYYRITKQGRQMPAQKQEEWEQYASAVAQVLLIGG